MEVDEELEEEPVPSPAPAPSPPKKKTFFGWIWPKDRPIYKRPALYIFGAVLVFAMMQQSDEDSDEE